MPFVHISLRKGWSPKQKLAICKDIQTAIKDVFQITHENFHHRINEYEVSDIVLPPGTSDKYILIELDLFPGRSEGSKQALFQRIEENLRRESIQPADIMIIYREPLLENWSLRGMGGKDVNRGYRGKDVQGEGQ